MKKKHRVKREYFLHHLIGYKVAVWRWWFPFWVNCLPTFTTEEDAMDYMSYIKKGYIYEA